MGRLFQSSLSLILVAVYLVAAMPVLPSITLPKRTAEPFPCEDHLCGCTGPDSCWTACGCHTPAERKAWAARRAVEIPAIALDETPAAGGCCHAEPAEPQACEPPAKPRGDGFSALQCKSVFGLMLMAVAPAAPEASLADVPIRVTAMRMIETDIVSSRVLRVPSPPPRSRC